MENEYVKRIDKLGEYNDYRENEVRKDIEERLKEFKRHIAKIDNPNSVVNMCKQYIHDIEFLEKQEMVCGEIRKTLVGLAIDFEKLEENKWRK